MNLKFIEILYCIPFTSNQTPKNFKILAFEIHYTHFTSNQVVLKIEHFKTLNEALSKYLNTDAYHEYSIKTTTPIVRVSKEKSTFFVKAH